MNGNLTIDVVPCLVQEHGEGGAVPLDSADAVFVSNAFTQIAKCAEDKGTAGFHATVATACGGLWQNPAKRGRTYFTQCSGLSGGVWLTWWRHGH